MWVVWDVFFAGCVKYVDTYMGHVYIYIGFFAPSGKLM